MDRARKYFPGNLFGISCLQTVIEKEEMKSQQNEIKQ